MKHVDEAVFDIGRLPVPRNGIEEAAFLGRVRKILTTAVEVERAECLRLRPPGSSPDASEWAQSIRARGEGVKRD